MTDTTNGHGNAAGGAANDDNAVGHDTWSATVAARYLWLAQRFTGRVVRYRELPVTGAGVPHGAYARVPDVLSLPLYGVRLEPHAAGGVLVIACSHCSLGIFHDAAGHISAPRTVLLPDQFVGACVAPAMPSLFDQGDEIPVAAPSELVPGVALLTDGFGLVCSADPEARGVIHSQHAARGNSWDMDRDYRLFDEASDPYPNWRAVLPVGPFRGLDTITIDPALFAPFARLSGNDNDPKSTGLRLWFSTDESTVLVRCHGYPEFVGALMPMKSTARLPAIPDWLQTVD